MPPNRSLRPSMEIVFAFLFIGLLAPLLAAVGVLLGPLATAAFIALTAAALSFALPIHLLVLGCLLAGTLLAGSLEYFAGISQAFWLPYLMGALLIGRALVAFVAPAKRDRLAQGRTADYFPVITLVATTYLLIVLFGVLATTPPVLQLLVAAKNYFFMWGVLLILLCGYWREVDTTRFWTTVALVACVQWPVVIYQRYVVAAGRRDAAAWDAVVGTFGGNPESGGHSPGMAFVCCLAVAILVSRMRDRRLGIATGIMLVATAVVPLALAEVKASFVWLALVFLIVSARQAMRQPVKAAATVIVGVALLVALAWTYQVTYKAAGGGSTIQEVYDRQIRYTFDPEEYRADMKRMGRMAAIVHWWQRHDIASEPVATLFGHGIGSSRSSSSLAVGEVAKRAAVPVDVNALSVLLWDVGLLGALAFSTLLVISALAALRLSQREELSTVWRESALLSACVLAMAASSLIYNRDTIDDAVIQMLIYFAIGQTILAKRQLQSLSHHLPPTLVGSRFRSRRVGSSRQQAS